MISSKIRSCCAKCAKQTDNDESALSAAWLPPPLRSLRRSDALSLTCLSVLAWVFICFAELFFCRRRVFDCLTFDFINVCVRVCACICAFNWHSLSALEKTLLSVRRDFESAMWVLRSVFKNASNENCVCLFLFCFAIRFHFDYDYDFDFDVIVLDKRKQSAAKPSIIITVRRRHVLRDELGVCK